MKHLILIIIPFIVFSQELTKEDINKACQTKGFTSKYGDSKNCIKELTETNNKQIKKIKDLKSIKNMKELFEYAESIDEKRFNSYPVIGKNFSDYASRSNLAKSLYSQLPYEAREYFNIYYKNKNGVILSRGPQSTEELKNYILNYKNEHFNDQLNLERLVLSLNKSKNDKNKLFKIYTSLEYHISELKFFSNDLKIKFYESIVKFNIEDKVKDEFLLEQFKREKDPIIIAAVFNSLSTDSQLKLDFDGVYNQLNKYINTGKFRDSYIPVSSVISVQTKLFHKVLILEVLNINFKK